MHNKNKFMALAIILIATLIFSILFAILHSQVTSASAFNPAARAPATDQPTQSVTPQSPANATPVHQIQVIGGRTNQ